MDARQAIEDEKGAKIDNEKGKKSRIIVILALRYLPSRGMIAGSCHLLNFYWRYHVECEYMRTMTKRLES